MGKKFWLLKREGDKMEFMGYLALPAFVFALSALSQASKLKDRVTELEKELKKIKWIWDRTVNRIQKDPQAYIDTANHCKNKKESSKKIKQHPDLQYYHTCL